MPPKKPATKLETIQPVSVVLVGTGDGKAVLPSGTTAVTPDDDMPNVVVTIITPLMALSIRFVNTYLTILVGLVVAGMTSNIIPADTFIALVWECAKLSVAGAGVGLLKDLVTVIGKLEGKYPLVTGAV